MAVQLINIGQIANDGTGDALREAMIKINANFEELDLRDDESTTASNIGATGEGIFAQRIGYDLQFKKLVASTDITLTPTDDTIVIAANGGLKTILVVTDSGSKILEETDNINILGGTDISTSLVGDNLTITYTGWRELVDDTTPQLGGNLDAQAFNLLNVGSITATNITGVFTGNLTGNVTSTGASSFSDISITNGSINGTIIGASAAAAITGTTITASGSFIGDLTGNVNGNLTGNITGNVVGDLTGNVIGNSFGYHTGDVTGSIFADNSSLMIDAINNRAFIGNLSFVGNVINSVSGETEIRSPTNLVLAPVNNIWISTGTKLIFEGTIPDDFEAKLQAGAVTADRDIFLPDEDGTLATREYLANVIPYFTDDYFDLGDLGANITSIAQWVFSSAEIDFGTFTLPDSRTVDLGSIV
jgi:hypothetical protein